MRNRNCALMASAALLISCQFASAWPARNTQPLNFRTGPGTGYHAVLVIPYGQYLEVRGCEAWCLVTYAGRDGWVSSNYIAPLEGGPPPIVTAPPVTRPPYWGIPVFKRRMPVEQQIPPAGIPREDVSFWQRMKRTFDW
ncbi:hypothetical protein E1162_05250 [Rhodobacteraceae bacterium RKSG542]|uniref:SH3 domain-containing protein n=1 Tax=Pseudovibrio flavus TaxID=2529854 RepID=UPI0012BD7797|nr:SH3 domain-containing protein [Pseudovibrio flavus]MTI16644.1 hypothetical protein [Pseudovibrio flavus]